MYNYTSPHTPKVTSFKQLGIQLSIRLILMQPAKVGGENKIITPTKELKKNQSTMHID